MVVQDKMDQALQLYHERQRIKTEEYRRRYGVLLLLLLMVGAGYFFLLH